MAMYLLLQIIIPIFFSVIFYINQESMIEQERFPAKPKPDENEYDYDSNPQIQPNPNIWNKFFFFNRIAMLYNYITGGIKRQSLLRYNDNYAPMLSTTTILEKYFRRKDENKQFNITAQLFKMEKGPFIFLIIMSFISGCSSLVPIYFQSQLAKAVIGTSGDYYQIYVVAGTMLARFFLLNYTLNLSSNIGMNVKLHLQNTFMRTIFYLQEDKYPALKGRIKYLDVDLIGEALFYVPYLITSIILVVGALAFTFIYVSPYSLIVIGVYLVLWIGIALTGYIAYGNMKIARRRVAQRQKYARRSLSNLMNAAFERMHDYVYQLLVVEKSLQTKRNIKINLLYILGQTFGQMCIVLSAITFFALAHNGSIAFANAYYAVLFLTTTFYPMRYIVYGFFTTLKALEAYRQIKHELQTVSKVFIKDIRFSNIPHDSHVFAQNIGDCFQYKFPKEQGEQEPQKKQVLNENPLRTQSGQELKEIQPRRMLSSSSLYNELEGIKIKTQKRKALNLPRLHDLPIQKGLVVMMVCKVDALIFPEDYYIEILINKPLGSSATKITSKNFMLPDTLRNNICFYSNYDEAKYHKILKITQLQDLQEKVNSASNRGGEQQYIKLSEWHETRIELARALYNNVDYLLIDKPLLLEDEQLLKNTIIQRRANNKMTLIANNIYWNYFKLADFILTIDRSTFQFGQLTKLKNNPRSLLNEVFMNHHEETSHIEKIPEIGRKDILSGIAIAPRVEDKPIQHLEKATFFQLFGFIHKKSEFIVIFALFAAPSFKYYMSYVIGKSLKQDIFWTYVIFGLIYIGLIFFRGLVLTLYTNFGSLALYEHLCRKNRRLNAHQILQLSQRPVVDVDYHQRIIDRNLVMDFEYGQSILIEIMVNFIVLCTGQPLYIAVAIPIIIGIVYSNANFARNAKKMYLLKLKQTKGVHKILALAVDKCQRIARYQKAPQINELFYKNNKIETIYDLNIEWLQTGVRTMSEFIVWFLFIMFLMIMVLTVKNQSTYTSLVGLGVTMFINLLYLNTFYLKAFRQAEISLYSLTVVFNMLRKPPNPTWRQVRRQQHFYLIKRFPYVRSIQYKNISLKYFKNVCDNINLTINEGDRIVLSGNSNSFKEMVFYMLKNKIFDRDEVIGDIIINGQIHEEFIIEGLFYLHTDPLLPFFGTIFEALKLSDPELTQGQLQALLIWYFNILGVQPLFSYDTPVQNLTLGKKQLFQAFKVLKIEKCKVLVIVDGLDHIDMVTRRRLTKYLIKNSEINILIETTNITEIVHLYPRRMIFNNLKVTEQVMKESEMQEQRKLVDSKQTMQMLAALERVPRNINTTQTFAEVDFSKDGLKK